MALKSMSGEFQHLLSIFSPSRFQLVTEQQDQPAPAEESGGGAYKL